MSIPRRAWQAGHPIVTTKGCGKVSDWHVAGAQFEEFARHMHFTMSFFHEWHLERALLANASAVLSGYIILTLGKSKSFAHARYIMQTCEL